MPTIDTPISSLSEPWEGHRGQHIEEIIKRELLARAGDFYYDPTNNRYLVFTSPEARATYLADPVSNSSLLLGTFDAPFNYNAEIHLLSPSYVPLLTGATGTYIDFTFDIKNKSGQSTGEDIVCTYTFSRGSIRNTVTQKYRSGTRVHFNIDQYLATGTTLVTIAITGVDSLAATTVGVTCQVIDLTLTDELDISAIHSPGDTLEIPYSISGFGAKVMEWYLDGQILDTIPAEDTITEVSTTRVKYIPLGQIPAGTHSIQFRAYTVVNGEKFYSPTAYRDFMVHTAGNSNNLAAVAFDLPLNVDPITDGRARLYGITQYEPYNLRIAIFNPSYAASTPVEIYVGDNDTALAVLSMSNNTVVHYSLVLTTPGSATITLVAYGITYTIPATVEETSTSLEEITQGLTLDLRAIGKSNESADRDRWTYKEISTAFNSFLWTQRSGWDNNRLNMSQGSGITVNYNPLESDALAYGKTLEFEFSTSNVKDNDAVICDIRQGTTGLLITASEASLTSATGAKVSTKYKSGENIRITFVINRRVGVVNRCLAFMYINGVLSGAANFPSNDNFLVNGDSFSITSSDNVEIALKSLRFYDTALNSSQVLNNFALYRDTAAEMMTVYDRNDIYTEGTSDFSTDALSAQLPVMIITGNIPALEATNDKKLQIDVDVDYINWQTPSLSFSIKNGAMTPQGTSSMSYPKKNFKLYTTRKDNTILYDHEGNIVSSRLYSFKEGAQPVDCWCLKADYAESSGTHNTGVARIWNDVMKNAVIDGEYKLRTKAQQAAIDSKYPYDVRTTVDGFPCVLFYRLDENSPLVFIGKYNFNNDKSTESVFGFRDIPGFDNSRMQCWELLNNGHHLGLFNDTDGWESEWDDAFEGRYPDGNTDTSHLKAFALWMSTVKESDFATQKWDHFDVYKMAAYYVYLMRFGAVDQVVKNSMLTSEDGTHWFFINYDNDTIFGVRNDGLLIYPPTIDRRTLDTTFSSEVYAYAGHRSRLWNMLEADEEFMRIVIEVDQALYIAGLSYAGVIDMFDDKQAGKWCERIYNQDAEYKYISPFTDRGVNNLFMLQGSRSAYRRWWVSERFALYDAKYVSGEYKANSVEVKLAGAPAGLTFEVTAGRDLSYGYGVNNVPIEYGVDLKRDEIHEFTTKSVLNVGDPLRIYAGPYIKSLMLSHLAPYMAQINLAPAYSERLGTCLENLLLWSNNTSLTELSGISQCTKLRYLDIRHLKALTSLDLSSNVNLSDLRATESGLTSVILPKDAPLKNVWLPGSLQFFRLDSISAELPLLTTCNIQALPNDTIEHGLFIEGKGCNITGVEIINCPNFDSKTFVLNWLTAKLADDNLCTLALEGINWTDFDADMLIRIGRRFRQVSLKGTIAVSAVSPEQVTALQEIYGNNCFSPGAQLFISAPGGAYIIGPSNITDFTTVTFSYAAFGVTGISRAVWSATSLPSGATFTDGCLTVGRLTADTSATIRLALATDTGLITTEQEISFIKASFPRSVTIEGPMDANGTILESIDRKGRYTFRLNIADNSYDNRFSVEWALTGDGADDGTVSIEENGRELSVNISAGSDIVDTTFGITARLLYPDGTAFNSLSRSGIIILLNLAGNVIMTKTSNPKVLAICYAQGWCANPSYMTDVEAAMVTNIGTAFDDTTLRVLDSDGNPTITFNEFVHFINVPSVSVYALRYFREVTCPFTELSTNNNSIQASCKNSTIHFPKLTKITNDAGTYNKVIAGWHDADFPVLETVPRYFIHSASIINLNAPLLSEFPDNALGDNQYLESIELNYEKGLSFTGSQVLMDTPLPDDRVFRNTVSITGAYPFYYSSPASHPFDEIVFSRLITLTTSSLLHSLCVRYLEFSIIETLTVGIASGNTFLEHFSAPKLTSYKNKTYCFSGCSALKTVDFPSLTTIGGYTCFYNCTNLEEVNMPALTEKIGISYFLFSNCSSLRTVDLSQLSKFNGCLFYGCDALESIELPLITDIDTGGGQFTVRIADSCPNLKNVALPNLKTVIGYALFNNCPNLETIYLPSLESITVHSSSYHMFTNSGKTIILPKLKDVPNLGGYNNYNTSIHNNTIIRVELMGAVCLKENCLRNLDTLETLILGPDLTQMALRSFMDCPKLSTIYCYAVTAPAYSSAAYKPSNIGSEVDDDTPKTIYVPAGAIGYDDLFSNLLDDGFEISYTL